MSTTTSNEPLLRVRDLVKTYQGRRTLLGKSKPDVHAVKGVSFDVPRNQTFAVVGETGSGKSTVAKTIMGFETATSGTIDFDGRDLGTLDQRGWRQVYRDLQFVFQDPYGSLPARMPVGEIITEPLGIHRIGTRAERRARVTELLEMVGMPASAANRYVHEFSGGMRQRVGIARALAMQPKMLILDEPVSALDVSIQAQVVNLLEDLQTEFGLTYLFIAHDLAVVRHIAHRVAVMHHGVIVEEGEVEAVFNAPQHEYTRSLLSAVPIPDPRLRAPRPSDMPAAGSAATTTTTTTTREDTSA